MHMPSHWIHQAAWALPAALLLTVSGCMRPFTPKEPPPKGDYVKVDSKETAKLTEKEYLMRRATLGSRSERIEAIDAIITNSRRSLRQFTP